MADEKNPSAAKNVFSFDGPNKLWKDQSSRHSESLQRHSVIRRLGLPTVGILVTTIFMCLLVLGFLSFLWHGNSESGLWHKIMINGWAARAVTIPTLLLRATIDLQAGVAASMIAALVLECGPVPVVDVVKWSVARGSKPRPRTLLFPSIRSRKLVTRSWIPIVAIATLCVTTVILQLASTILLSDFDSGVLRKFPSQNQLLYDYIYPVAGPWQIIPGGWAVGSINAYHYPQKYRTTTWLRNPPAYPTFAEYSIPAKSQGPYVDDTGTLLRAFLPYADAARRQSVSEYIGKTLVMDSRVSCQPPELTNVIANELGFGTESVDNGNSVKSLTALQISGTLQPTQRNLDRLWAPDLAIPFTCFAGYGSSNTAICQLNAESENDSNAWNQAGGLISEFANVTNITEIREIAANQAQMAEPIVELTQNGSSSYITWGTPLLVIQAMSWGPLNSKQDRFLNNSNFGGTPYPLQNASVHPKSESNSSGPWTVIKSDVDWHSWRLRASLCYTAWDTASLDVSMSSEKILEEPMQHWHPASGLYTSPRVTDQLLTTSNLSYTDRQILTLKEKSSWIPLRDDVGPVNAMPFIQAYADLSGKSLSPCAGMAGNYTAVLDQASLAQAVFEGLAKVEQVELADDTLVWLFDSFMESSNSVAHSISALITVLSGMAYYDQLPRFQAETNATQVFFTEVLFPHNFGGFWTIFATVMVHTTFMMAVTAVFLTRSQVSFVGNHWHSVTQLVSFQTVGLLEGNTVSTDREVGRQLRPPQTSEFAAQLTPMEGGQGAQVVIIKSTQCV